MGNPRSLMTVGPNRVPSGFRGGLLRRILSPSFSPRISGWAALCACGHSRRSYYGEAGLQRLPALVARGKMHEQLSGAALACSGYPQFSSLWQASPAALLPPTGVLPLDARVAKYSPSPFTVLRPRALSSLARTAQSPWRTTMLGAVSPIPAEVGPSFSTAATPL